MKRTTIVADDDLVRRMKHLAARRGTTFTVVVQEAMRAYLAAQQSSTIASLAGIAPTSMPVDYSNGRDEEILAAEIHPIYGFAPPSPDTRDE